MDTIPTLSNAIPFQIHIFSAARSTYKESHPAIGLSCSSIKQHRKNNLLTSVGVLPVIGIKQLMIVRCQTIASGNNLLAGGNTVGVTSLTSVNLGVKVQFGQQSIGCSLISPTVDALSWSWQRVNRINQFRLYPIEKLDRLVPSLLNLI